MKTKIMAALALGAPLALWAPLAQAQGFTWDGEIEIANDQIVRSDLAANEIRDTHAILTFGAGYDFGNGVSLFSSVVGESVTGATADRTFDDMGVYIEELGVSFALGEAATLSVGKLHPVFGVAWDETAGFYGGNLAEDYELAEQLGALAEFDLGAGGNLAAAVFFADNSSLSNSWGHRRGRNETANGGAGNTGKLNNIALQWQKEFGATTARLGARHLSAGVGDVSDENGVVAGLQHSVADLGLDLFGEVASFDGFRGTNDDATYATLNAAYLVAPQTTLSATLARREVDSAGTTDLVSIAAEYEFANGYTVGGAVARVRDAGVSNTLVGINLIIPLGG